MSSADLLIGRIMTHRMTHSLNFQMGKISKCFFFIIFIPTERLLYFKLTKIINK